MRTGQTSVIAAPATVLAGLVMLAAVYGVLVDSPFVWIYVAITIVLGSAVAVVHIWVDLSIRSLWLLVAAAAINLAGGVLLVGGQPLYVLHLWGDLRFDKPAHFVTTGLAAVVAYQVIDGQPAEPGTIPSRSLAVLVAMGLGALVEVVEYVGTLVVPNANVGDYGDNMLDLIANLLGAVAAVVLIPRFSLTESRDIVSDR